jgi:mono/diheme cytochrome c family protein
LDWWIYARYRSERAATDNRRWQMKKKMRLLLTLTGSALLLSGSLVFAQQDSIGMLEFQKQCAACHGMDGKGTGPFLEFLKQTPSDLTLLSKKNGGVFPYKQVYSWIEDPQRIRAHGTSEMPIWGDRYNAEVIEKYGPYDTGSKAAKEVQARILELVFFLATIQE